MTTENETNNTPVTQPESPAAETTPARRGKTTPKEENAPAGPGKAPAEDQRYLDLLGVVEARGREIEKQKAELQELKNSATILAEAKTKVATYEAQIGSYRGFVATALEAKVKSQPPEILEALGFDVNAYKDDPLTGFAALEAALKLVERVQKMSLPDPTKDPAKAGEKQKEIASFNDDYNRYIEIRKGKK